MTLPFLIPLEGTALRDAGVPAPYALGLANKVTFSELDAFNHVNNARYLSWFETFRIAYFKARGLGDYSDPDDKPIVVLKQVGIDYRAPLYIEDSYVVAGRTRAFRRRSFTMEYGVWRDGTLCATSHAVICLMEQDFVTMRALPAKFTTTFETMDGAVFEG
ncbi:acyl-CoA thioesterase [Jannaschia sp. M317]|uniref:acyl-CoA thioesterase n=1 Tax=Jannaschia sp. M317 TaxID=2867011 RepID=UPI0021A29236|nr:acyl-CoA thioesterase [Jannaschia sp. M317]UWQ16391.1 acyl-CoA thioesterase [Jannaschia sp. M317]